MELPASSNEEKIVLNELKELNDQSSISNGDQDIWDQNENINELADQNKEESKVEELVRSQDE